jgi:hypothetical protein
MNEVGVQEPKRCGPQSGLGKKKWWEDGSTFVGLAMVGFIRTLFQLNNKYPTSTKEQHTLTHVTVRIANY